MTKIFKIPFATQGDRTAVPDDVQADGSLSYTQGYGYDYERDQATDPAAKDIEREKMNSIFHDITGAVGEIQAFGMPVWAEEGKPYAIRSVVYHNKKAWQSKIENNNTEPAAGVAWTELKADVTAEDVGAYTKVEANLKFQPVGNYADKNEVNGKLAKDQNGADIQDKAAFISNLGLGERFQPKGEYQPAGNYALQSEVNKKRDITDIVFPGLVYDNPEHPNDNLWFYNSTGGGSGIARTKNGVPGYNNFREGKTGDVAHTDELFGAGQRWVDVTASRQQGVVYTNTTPKTIFIAISHIHSNKANGEYVGFGFSVDGEVPYSATATNNMWMEALSVPVQPGGKYVFNADPTQINYKKWMEFRG